VCSRNASRAPWRKAPERTRWIPCARAVRCARAAIAPDAHVEHGERATERVVARERARALKRFRTCESLLGARVNVTCNTTDATTGATALLLPACEMLLFSSVASRATVGNSPSRRYSVYVGFMLA
jgi:hypothetical protein